MNDTSSLSSTTPFAFGTLVLNPAALRTALIDALTDPTVIEKLTFALHGCPASSLGPMPKFMTAKEYAAHARISQRSLSYARQKMTEGIHFSRTGSRVRFHVAEADEFISRAKSGKPVVVDANSDLKVLARQEAGRRRLKPKGAE